LPFSTLVRTKWLASLIIGIARNSNPRRVLFPPCSLALAIALTLGGGGDALRIIKDPCSVEWLGVWLNQWLNYEAPSTDIKEKTG
jgi:hypothetical protein